MLHDLLARPGRSTGPFSWASAVLLGWGAGVAAQAPGAERRPNVVVILSDDQGWADLSCQGLRVIDTPNIDRLAREGVRCTQAYSGQAFCAPTRASLLSGCYPQTLGFEDNPRENAAADLSDGLEPDTVLLPSLFQQAGYVTGAIGKWHLGQHDAQHPNRKGFTFFFGFLGGGHSYVKSDPPPPTGKSVVPGRDYQQPLQRNGSHEAFAGYLTDRLFAEACAFVEAHAAEPFLLYVAPNAVHTPLQAKPEDLEAVAADVGSAKRRANLAMLRALDAGVGALLDDLDRLKLRDDTLVVFMGDNGGQTLSGADNGVLRGRKGQMYEGGIRVPMLWRWPGRLPEAATYERPVHGMDVLPTALAAAGIELPQDVRVDGVDLRPFLAGERGDADAHAVLCWRRHGDWPWAVRAGHWKLLVQREGVEELFDLTRDPSEQSDRRAEEPEVAARLRSAFLDWQKSVRAPRWLVHVDR
ncbi:MAG: sulfatase-like hydrolase/transferase [Planctomycetota bacterium]